MAASLVEELSSIAGTTATSEILLPRTEAGAAVQVLVVALVTLVVAVLVRGERSLVMLTIGVGLVVLALMGMRTLH